jgi:hypothetical protein
MSNFSTVKNLLVLFFTRLELYYKKLFLLFKITINQFQCFSIRLQDKTKLEIWGNIAKLLYSTKKLCLVLLNMSNEIGKFRIEFKGLLNKFKVDFEGTFGVSLF